MSTMAQLHNTNDILACALSYAKDGWPVFPCDPATKQPLTANGFKAASRDEQQIKAWWARHPNAMIGLPTGPKSGIWVLDIDNGQGKDGGAALATLESTYGALPDTAKVTTPSGGCHYYFRYDGEVRNRGQLAPGIDVRGDGGYVIAAGSIRSDGTFYEWAVAGEPADAPSWLMDKVTRTKTAEKPSPAPVGTFNQRYVDAAINGELVKLIGTASGRNNALNDCAYAIGQFVGAGVLSRADAESRLYGAAIANGYVAKDGEQAARATINSGLDSGMTEPREVPADQANANQAATTAFLDKVWAAQPANDNTAFRLGQLASADVLPLPGAVLGLPLIDPSDWHGLPIPERKWIVPGFFPDRQVTLFSGEGGTGKSLAALQLLVAMAFGLKWLDQEVTQGGGLYYGAEDEVDEQHIRLADILRSAGRTFADLTNKGVRLIPMADRDAVLAEPDKSGKILETAIFPLLRAHVERMGPKLIIIDTSADAFGGDEISRKQVRAFIKLLRTLAIQFDCAVLLLSHPSLTGISSGSGLSGSTAWNGSVRSRLYMTADDEDDDVRKIKTVKANYGRKGSEIAVRWNEGVFVVDEGPDPAVGSLLNKKADELFLDLLCLFTAQGQNLSPSPSPSYAPKMMADHPKAKGTSKKKLEEAMQRLLEAKRIRIVTEGPPSRQRSRLMVMENGLGV